jgi:adenylate cyclase
MMELSFIEQQQPTHPLVKPQGTQQLTRDLILESLDQHAVLLTEVATRLNTMLNLNTALQEVSHMMKVAMGADRCEVILADQFDKLSQLGFATSIAKQALEQRSAVIVQDAQSNPSLGKSASLLRIHAALCVPVMSGDQILGLIYVFKNRPQARPFGQRDLQLAIAIGHQAALTIQRVQLMERVKKEELVTKLLQRFLSPQEIKYVMKEYLETGQLPPLSECELTVLAIDISNSTKIAERLGAPEFSKLLSRYYQDMASAIFKFNGMLNKYIGDGLMAVFGLPQQPPNPEDRSIRAALEILNKLTKINSELNEQINIGIGINTGRAMAGYLGSLEYIEFTVIGHPVNIAWGLESKARPNRILVGQSTFQAVNGNYEINPLGPLEIKDYWEPVEAYEVKFPQFTP